ncbi:MAG: thiol protease/hemagglutinin PrtT [Paludibacteraceae bacterium]|nr:thiol protease/hemagglutinin PrtT [Paludibacteraceae bacterium]
MRRLCTILFVMLWVCSLYAERRSVSEALQIAERQVCAETSSYINGSKHGVSATQKRQIQGYAKAELAAESEAWMAVNTGEGFVLVGADDRLPEVLGWSDNGRFDIDSINDNLRYWLSCYDRFQVSGFKFQVSYPFGNDLLRCASFRFQVTGEGLQETVEPLCTTKWNQSNPFNQKCPEYKSGNMSATGCVATAMAQMMARYSYPSIGVGEHSYGWVRGEGDTVQLYARFDSVAYNWELMKSKTTLAIYNAQCDQISTLMYHCGVSVDMKYGASSSASTTTAARSLVKYFGYDKGIQNIQCNVLPGDSVLRIMYRELSEGRPVMIAGTSEQNTRHAFLADGYNRDGYFHINWGWGGSSDGYYLMSSFSPSGSQGAGSGGKTYGMNQTLIVGVQPAAENALPASHMGIDSLTVDQTEYQNGKSYLGGWIDLSPTIRVNMVRVQNFGLYDFAGEYGLALMDADKDSIVSVLDKRNLTLRSGYFRTGTNKNLREVFSFKTSSCEEGVYRLAHIYRDTAQADWYISYARYSPSFMYMQVRKDSVILSYDRPESYIIPIDTTGQDSIVVTPDTIPLPPDTIKPDTTLTPSAIGYVTASEITVQPTLLIQGETFGVYGNQSGDKQTAEIEILDVNGAAVDQRKHAKLPYSMAAPMRQGVYVVRISRGEQISVKKIVVR